MPDTVVFENVEVISASDLGLICMVQGKVVSVGALQVLPESTVRSKGDRGRLVLPRWAVDELGLAVPPLS